MGSAPLPCETTAVNATAAFLNQGLKVCTCFCATPPCVSHEVSMILILLGLCVSSKCSGHEQYIKAVSATQRFSDSSSAKQVLTVQAVPAFSPPPVHSPRTEISNSFPSSSKSLLRNHAFISQWPSLEADHCSSRTWKQSGAV